MQELTDIAKSLKDLGYLVMVHKGTLVARSGDKRSVFTMCPIVAHAMQLRLAVNGEGAFEDAKAAIDNAGMDIDECERRVDN